MHRAPSMQLQFSKLSRGAALDAAMAGHTQQTFFSPPYLKMQRERIVKSLACQKVVSTRMLEREAASKMILRRHAFVMNSESRGRG